jgi:hypothetical protein
VKKKNKNNTSPLVDAMVRVAALKCVLGIVLFGSLCSSSWGEAPDRKVEVFNQFKLTEGRHGWKSHDELSKFNGYFSLNGTQSRVHIDHNDSFRGCTS